MTPSRVAVTNNTPVSNLIRVGQLPLLGLLFGSVLVPQQVADELDRGKHVLGAWREAPAAGPERRRRRVSIPVLMNARLGAYGNAALDPLRIFSSQFLFL